MRSCTPLLLITALVACGEGGSLVTGTSPVDAVCTPEPAAPYVPLSLEVSTCEACGGGRSRCVGTREFEDTLVLRVEYDIWVEGDEVCLAICIPATVTCIVPPLPPRTYLLRSEQVGLAETLVVGTSSIGAATSCRLSPSPG